MNQSTRFLIAGFLGGLIIGGVSTGYLLRYRMHHMTPEKRENRLLHRFRSKLNLSEDQQRQLKVLLRQGREKMESLMAETRPKFEEIRKSTGDEIRKTLTPEQQIKFDAMRAEHEKHRHERPAEFGFR